MPTALAATLLRARQSKSFFTVPHYKYTRTHTTYIHWSTSGSVPRKLWPSSGTVRNLEGHTHTHTHCREGRAGMGVSVGATSRVGAAHHGGTPGLTYYYHSIMKKYSKESTIAAIRPLRTRYIYIYIYIQRVTNDVTTKQKK